ncbi:MULTISPECIES: serine hydrolase [Sphingobacterium]|uniref:serine hydrolase n=1 Tax=Sphingobacterium TaxID=28453 RepID=UPI002580E685|nr:MULTISPECIES: serine hydrolase [Sphingobacterium]
MKTSLLVLLCLIFSLLVQVIALAQTNQQQFDSLTSAQFAKDGAGTVVYLSRGDQVLYQKAFGKANIELDVAMTPEHVFRLASVTKQFTAVLILMLQEQGKLSIQDDIRKYIPDFPEKKKVITIEALLTHTSGVVNYTGLPSFTDEIKLKGLSPRLLVDLVKSEPLDYDPGSDYKYSNSGYILLGYIIEQITGKSYAEFIEETIFKPLEMTHSYYDTPTRIIFGRVSGYVQRNGAYRNADYLSMSLPYAAGSLMSTAGDLQKWYNGLHNCKLLKSEIIRKAQTSFKLNDGRLTGYGYGWETGNVQGSPSVKHVGVVNGFFTYAAYLPLENLSITILRNCDTPYEPDILASKLLAVALGKPYDYKPITLKSSELEVFQGVYNIKNGRKHSVRLQDGNLMYYYLGGPKTRLVPNGKDQFLVENSLNTFKFTRDEKGIVDGFTASGTGMPSSAVRENTVLEAQPKINVSKTQLAKYTGKYQFNPGPVFEVVLENNILYGQVGNDRKELVPFDKHKFYARDLDATIVFNVDNKGTAIGLTKIQNSNMVSKKL